MIVRVINAHKSSDFFCLPRLLFTVYKYTCVFYSSLNFLDFILDRQCRKFSILYTLLSIVASFVSYVPRPITITRYNNFCNSIIGTTYLLIFHLIEIGTDLVFFWNLSPSFFLFFFSCARRGSEGRKTRRGSFCRGRKEGFQRPTLLAFVFPSSMAVPR